MSKLNSHHARGAAAPQTHIKPHYLLYFSPQLLWHLEVYYHCLLQLSAAVQPTKSIKQPYSHQQHKSWLLQRVSKYCFRYLSIRPVPHNIYKLSQSNIKISYRGGETQPSKHPLHKSDISFYTLQCYNANEVVSLQFQGFVFCTYGGTSPLLHTHTLLPCSSLPPSKKK